MQQAISLTLPYLTSKPSIAWSAPSNAFCICPTLINSCPWSKWSLIVTALTDRWPCCMLAGGSWQRSPLPAPLLASDQKMTLYKKLALLLVVAAVFCCGAARAQVACTWPGHCLGDPCRTYNDCDQDWICVSGRCAIRGKGRRQSDGCMHAMPAARILYLIPWRGLGIP